MKLNETRWVEIRKVSKFFILVYCQPRKVTSGRIKVERFITRQHTKHAKLESNLPQALKREPLTTPNPQPREPQFLRPRYPTTWERGD